MTHPTGTTTPPTADLLHEPVGLIGLGVTGQRMALDLARAGTDLIARRATTEQSAGADVPRAHPLMAALGGQPRCPAPGAPDRTVGRTTTGGH